MSKSATHLIDIQGLGKSFRQNSASQTIFEGLNLSVSRNEFLTLFGPNGCGKTTLLNIIAGLLDYDEGSITFTEEKNKINIGYVFQNFENSLFPWRTNLDNIAFALEIKGFSKTQRKKKAIELLEKLGIDIPLSLYPYQISGGQKQLVAMARSLIYEPDVLLLDEPFSALDYKNRLFLQEKLLDIWKKTHTTIIFISHELEEAIYLADRTILLSPAPGTGILKNITINLPRPRVQDMKATPEFYRVFKELSGVFRKAVKT